MLDTQRTVCCVHL